MHIFTTQKERQRMRTTLIAVMILLYSCVSYGYASWSEVYTAPVGNNIGVLTQSTDTGQKPTNLRFELYDPSGTQLSGVTLPKISDQCPVYNPTFVVAPNGDVYIFWHAGLYLCGAVVDQKGGFVIPPKYVVDKAMKTGLLAQDDKKDGCPVSGPFLASFCKDEIVGVTLPYVDPCDCILITTTWLKLDKNLNVLSRGDQVGMGIRPGDSVAVDDTGRLHVLYGDDIDNRSKPGKRNICYAVFDPMGQLEEKKLVAEVEASQHLPRPAKDITLDPEGSVHIYYLDRGVKHITIKGKTPARGHRMPIILTDSRTRIDADGKVTKFSCKKRK